MTRKKSNSLIIISDDTDGFSIPRLDAGQVPAERSGPERATDGAAAFGGPHAPLPARVAPCGAGRFAFIVTGEPRRN